MGSSSSACQTFVVLLRGINVAGKNKVPMKTLVAIFEKAGCTSVRHYIQSGNVVFNAPAAVAQGISKIVEKEIARSLSLKVPVVVRSAKEMRAVLKSNPLIAEGADEATCHVMFLADKPGKKECAALDPDRSPPDTFVVRGREIYLNCPNGVARTKLTNNYFDAALHTTSTGRNWRTVRKLAAMCDEIGED